MSNLSSKIANRYMRKFGSEFFLRTSKVHNHRRKAMQDVTFQTPSFPLTEKDIKKWNKRGSVVYSGVILTPTSQMALVRWWEANVGEMHDKVVCHHCTLQFKPTLIEVESLPLGSKVQLKVVGVGSDEKAQAVFVEIGGGLNSTNKKPHITVAIPNGGSAKDSNDLAVERKGGLTLEGYVGYFGRGKLFKQIAWRE